MDWNDIVFEPMFIGELTVMVPDAVLLCNVSVFKSAASAVWTFNISLPFISKFVSIVKLVACASGFLLMVER